MTRIVKTMSRQFWNFGSFNFDKAFVAINKYSTFRILKLWDNIDTNTYFHIRHYTIWERHDYIIVVQSSTMTLEIDDQNLRICLTPIFSIS